MRSFDLCGNVLENRLRSKLSDTALPIRCRDTFVMKQLVIGLRLFTHSGDSITPLRVGWGGRGGITLRDYTHLWPAQHAGGLELDRRGI
jgi:hypothetical protein